MTDYVKMGEFIAKMRKNQGMTQRQLAERLSISDKTISKWETGRSTPDISMIVELCDILEISVNGLLSGEEISGEAYVKRAEENLVDLIKEGERKEEENRLAKAGIAGGSLLLAVMTAFLLFGLTQGYKEFVWFLDGVSLSYVIGVTFLVLLLSGVLPDFGRAFVIAWGKGAENGPKRAAQALAAVETALLTCLLSGILAFLTGFILLVVSQTDREEMLRSMGTNALPVFYGVLFVLMMLPTAVRLKKVLGIVQ